MHSNLTNTRIAQGLTQVDLARLADTTQPTVSRLETGVYRRGQVATQVRLARALGVTVESIFPYPDAT